MRILFANITEWGSKTEQFVAQKEFDLFMFVEHKLMLHQLRQKSALVAKQGYRLAATAATKANVANSGGAMCLCKKHLTLWPRERAPLLHEGAVRPTQAHGHDWIAMQLSLRGTAVTIYVVYLTSAIGASGVNIEKLEQICSSMRHIRGPLMLIGDWNMEYQELLAADILSKAAPGLEPMLPNTHFTCTVGKGKVIDYAIVNQKAKALFSALKVEPTGPWKHIRLLPFLRARQREPSSPR